MRMHTLLAALVGAAWAAVAQAPEAIDIGPFRDAISHWDDKHGRDRDDPRFSPDNVIAIAGNLIAYQNPDGGWPKNVDWLADIPREEMERLYGASLHRSTFDNRTTYTQVEYLAKAYAATGDAQYAEAAARGLDYIFAEQRPSGGWRGSDVDAITFNDDVMTGIMRLLLAIRNGAPHFDWLDEAQRAQANAALDRAISVTLACQIRVDGVLTAWCQQHDHETLAPVKARSYELPSITAGESVGVVRFLMELDPATPGVAEAIEAAVAWFKAAAIHGIRVERVPIEPVRFEHHTATTDRVVIEDPDAPPIWARFYEIETNRPFFANRDGVKVYRLEDVALERRSGYGWYTGAPGVLLEREHPAWKARLAAE